MMAIMYRTQTGGAKAGSVRHRLIAVSFVVGLLVHASLAGMGQTTAAADGSIATPRPINPAASTTNPSARATQSQNPYLGSVPEEQVTNGLLELDLQQAVDRGLKYNLGLIDSVQADADVRAATVRAWRRFFLTSPHGLTKLRDISYSETESSCRRSRFAGLPQQRQLRIYGCACDRHQA